MFGNSVVVIDGLGRILIPKAVRKLFSTNRFVLEARDEKLMLTPLASWDKLFGSIPELDLKKFKAMHDEEALNDDSAR